MRGNELLDFDGLMRLPEWRALVPLIERIGGNPAGVLPRLALYARLVLAWNATVSNLVSRNDEGRIVSRHIRESIEPAAMLAATGVVDWLDFGSGAGFPALPLAILDVGSQWTLVESRRPKALFLRRATQELALDGVRVVHARLEDVVAEGGSGSAASGPPDSIGAGTPAIPSRGEPGAEPARRTSGLGGFTSRATVGLVRTLELASHVLRPGGSAFLWKGSRRSDELAERDQWSHRWALDSEIVLSGGEVAVCSFIFKG